MNKIFIIIKREFLTRVKKKSFLIATILTPLLFPAIIGGIIYLMVRDEATQESKKIEVYDPGEVIPLESNSRFEFIPVMGDSTERVSEFLNNENYAHLEINQSKGKVFRMYTKSSLSLSDNDRLEDIIEAVIRRQNLDSLRIDDETLAAIRPNINLSTFNIKEQKQSSSITAWIIGYATGFLIYMFLFVYGAQVMQGVIEEKSNKIVEIIVATVKPFQLMMGKVIGIASVGILQVVIWIVLISAFSFTIFSLFGVDMDQANSMSQMNQMNQMNSVASDPDAAQEIANTFYSIPFFSIITTFIFYFLGGYLLYGALFAAVGSAVDSPSEAQQFMFPITIPLIASIIGLSAVLQNPDGNLAFWMSIIPFTSPIAMMGRMGFGMPPLWELLLSMTLLVGGFMGTIWIAGRIYRVGILMHGTKVNYKVLARWFMMRN